MKKTMRKSALLSSVAMLIVSAIVLTSATYAWFSASNRVNVEEISATVESSSGLLISIDQGASWKTTVNVSDKKANSFSPVSTASGANGSFVTGAYKDGTLNLLAATAGADGQFMQYEIWVKGPGGKTVTVTPSFTGTDANVQKVVKFALYDMNASRFLNNGVIAADGSTGTYGGTSSTGSFAAEESSGAFITDQGTVTINEISGYTFSLASETDIHKFLAYVWVEGNDPDCKAADIVSGSALNFAVEMSVPE